MKRSSTPPPPEKPEQPKSDLYQNVVAKAIDAAKQGQASP